MRPSQRQKSRRTGTLNGRVNAESCKTTGEAEQGLKHRSFEGQRERFESKKGRSKKESDGR